jgi:hypothetical protein
MTVEQLGALHVLRSTEAAPTYAVSFAPFTGNRPGATLRICPDREALVTYLSGIPLPPERLAALCRQVDRDGRGLVTVRLTPERQKELGL